MNDGIIKNDGTSRFLAGTFPATYEEFRQLAEQKKLPVDILFNAAGWLAQPDFLNKANLLKDKTAAMYGFGPDTVVDTILSAIPEKVGAQVGDIRSTVKNDLDDTWLLCNGATVQRTDYPELAKYFPKDFGGKQTKTQVIRTNSFGTRFTGLAIIDGNYVAVGYRYSMDNDTTWKDVIISYRPVDNPSATWTTKVLWKVRSDSLGSYDYGPSIAHGNGYIVVGGVSGSKSGTIAYATSVNGTWKSLTVFSGRIYSTRFLNNEFVVVGTKGDRACISHASNPSATSNWTTKTFLTNNTSNFGDVVYAEGKYVVFAVQNDTGYVFSGETIESLAQTATLGTNYSGWNIHSAVYADGVYVFTKPGYSSSRFKVVYAGDIRGPWQELEVSLSAIPGSGLGSQVEARMLGCVYSDGVFFFYGGAVGNSNKVSIVVGASKISSDLAPWKIYDYADIESAQDYYSAVTDMLFNMQTQDFVFTSVSDDRAANFTTITAKTFKLPSIPSKSSEFNYIKAKR